MFGFWHVLEAVAAYLNPKQKKVEYRLLYGQGRLVNDQVMMDCGCRFNWADPRERPMICAAHRAIITAEVAA